MDYKAFYKELMTEMYAVLKPHGFRKTGTHFRRELDNGIVWEVEVQKSEFNMPSMGWSQFTVNVKAGLFSTPVTVFSWKENYPQIQGHLGTCVDEGFSHQYWYQVLDPADSRRKNGAWTLSFQEPGKDWQEKQIPCPMPDEIVKQVCGLLADKAIPFYLSLQTLDAYLDLLEREEELKLHSMKRNEDCLLYAKVFGEKFLPCLERWIVQARKNAQWQEAQDMSHLDEFYQQSHKKHVAGYWERVTFLEELRKTLE